MDTILITGATGLVGRNLAARLLATTSDSRLVLVVRAGSDGQARARALRSLADVSRTLGLPVPCDRIEVLAGDITRPRLGLSVEEYRMISGKITHLIHAAASVKFQARLETARRTNVVGTRNVLELAERAVRQGPLRHAAYLSTAYVCGNHTGRVVQGALRAERGFANSYEATKFAAERLVRSRMGSVPTTILRPSIIVGDSSTGYTSAFNVLYAPLRMIASGALDVLPGSAETGLDVVPVDYVCEQVLRAFADPRASIGRTHHVTAGRRDRLTAGDVVDRAVAFFREHGVCEARSVEFVPAARYGRLLAEAKGSKRRLLEAAAIYSPYLTRVPVFETTLPPPPAYRSYDARLLAFCLETDWGRGPRSATVEDASCL